MSVKSAAEKSGEKNEYLNNFANISSYIISVFFVFHSIQTGRLIENSKQLLSSVFFFFCKVLLIYYMAQFAISDFLAW